MFRIKICGITTPEDSVACTTAGADAIGLNFYVQSSRCIDVPTAREIVASAGEKMAKVGVFVNHPPGSVLAIRDALDLDFVQLHGDEPVGDILRLNGIPVVKAFRTSQRNASAIRRYLDEVLQAGMKLGGVLVDAYVRGQFGGTGAVADWTAVGELKTAYPELPIVLAGGLNPNNVGAAIRTAKPDAVDTASGVEIHARQKDPAAILAFVAAARRSFAKPD